MYRIKESVTVSADGGKENSVSKLHSKYAEKKREEDETSMVVQAAAAAASETAAANKSAAMAKPIEFLFMILTVVSCAV